MKVLGDAAQQSMMLLVTDLDPHDNRLRPLAPHARRTQMRYRWNV
jgi:hypothetical protein